MNDERLVRRAVAGDERAFAAIFRRYNQDLYRYCLAIVGNPADAQDALQNTMVKALRSLPGERREINLKPWLYRVAHNESIDLLRLRRGEELDPETVAPGASLAETATVRQRLRGLIADLGRLPERQRGALVMRELSDLGFEQIGEALGTSAATARQIVYEARLGLRQMEAGREMRCETVTRAISDGDGRTLRRRDVRAHLRACSECRAFRAGIEQRHGDLAALSPLPAVAAAALLKGALGTAGGAGSVTGAASAGGGAAAIGGATGTGGGAVGGAAASGGALGAVGVAAKTAATVAAVAAIGVGAADRTGVIHVTGSSGERATRTTPAAAGGAAAAGEGAGPIGRPAGAAESPPDRESTGPDTPASANYRRIRAAATRSAPSAASGDGEQVPGQPKKTQGRGPAGSDGAGGRSPAAGPPGGRQAHDIGSRGSQGDRHGHGASSQGRGTAKSGAASAKATTKPSQPAASLPAKNGTAKAPPIASSPAEQPKPAQPPAEPPGATHAQEKRAESSALEAELTSPPNTEAESSP